MSEPSRSLGHAEAHAVMLVLKTSRGSTRIDADWKKKKSVSIRDDPRRVLIYRDIARAT
jgi:hypothetical protein